MKDGRPSPKLGYCLNSLIETVTQDGERLHVSETVFKDYSERWKRKPYFGGKKIEIDLGKPVNLYEIKFLLSDTHDEAWVPIQYGFV